MKARILQLIARRRAALFSALGLAVLASSGHATSLVVNGNFEQLLQPGVASEFGSRFASQQVTGWTTDGYNFVFTPGSADTTGANGEYGPIYLWGPGTGSNNGLPATSPAGGNYIAMDGAYAVGPVSQTLNGLTPGKAIDVSFYWAGAQQSGFYGPTTEQFQVSLGSQSQLTAVLDNPSEGFTGWRQEIMTFVPTSTSEVLSFLSIGTPNGVPPFALLDGVSAYAPAPEPSTWALLGGTLVGLGALGKLRRKQADKK